MCTGHVVALSPYAEVLRSRARFGRRPAATPPSQRNRGFPHRCRELARECSGSSCLPPNTRWYYQWSKTDCLDIILRSPWLVAIPCDEVVLDDESCHVPLAIPSGVWDARDMAITLNGLRTVVYPTDDLAASKACWSELLGMDPYFTSRSMSASRWEAMSWRWTPMVM